MSAKGRNSVNPTADLPDSSNVWCWPRLHDTVIIPDGLEPTEVAGVPSFRVLGGSMGKKHLNWMFNVFLLESAMQDR